MVLPKLQVRLPRRVAAYFLLFSLVSLVWLSIGIVYVAHAISDSSESASLRAVGSACHRIALARLKDKDGDLSGLVAELSAQHGAAYCAVLAPTGGLLAHSDPALRDSPLEERPGATDEWGDVLRVQYVDAAGRAIHEYRAPVRGPEAKLGTLVLGVAQPSLWNYVRVGLGAAPLAIVGPFCCIAAGVVLLNRMVEPVADIEQQLHQVATSPSVEGCQLRPVPSSGAAALGWNRVVQQRQVRDQTDGLQQRIRSSLEQGRQSRLDAVLNSVPDGVATTDAEGRITYTNLPMAVLLGLKDVIKGGTGDDQSPLMSELLVARWHLSEGDPLAAQENRDRSVVTELTREENAQRRVARLARHPICIVGQGGHETHVWTMRDVTQQKLAEEMRDQFVDTATHELRTPLANIKAYAETLALADVIDVEQQKQFLNTINSEASRLARFVDDLLSVSSMEVGSLSLNKQVIDLSRMLQEVLVKVRPQMEEKELDFEVTLPEKMPEPELDKDKISAVLVNLLGNAVKYTPEKGRVAFRVNITDRQIEISIEDTGVGIAEEELAKVFEKFFRSQDPRVQSETGTGLGLALAQEVVRLHGGRITVESELDKGSTFTVLLPLG